MSIITDGVHVVSTESEAELHAFAQRIGLKREWYQNHPKHPHYDITTQNKLTKAFKAGAIKVTGIDIVRQAWWAKNNPANKLNEALHPDATTLAKLGSAIVHAEEFLSATGHNNDLVAFRAILSDPAIAEWLQVMTKAAMLPVKRS